MYSVFYVILYIPSIGPWFYFLLLNSRRSNNNILIDYSKHFNLIGTVRILDARMNILFVIYIMLQERVDWTEKLGRLYDSPQPMMRKY